MVLLKTLVNLWYLEGTLERLEVSASFAKLAWISEEQRQSWNLLEPRSFDIYMNVIVSIIAMLDCSEIDMKVLNIGMKSTEFDDYREILGNDRDTNSILAVIQEKARFFCKDR